jgi:hypothetical protein
MAEGTILVFDKMRENIGLKLMSLDADTYFLMLVQDSGATPDVGDTNPTYVAGGTPDYSLAANEVDDTGVYVNGGLTLGAVSWSEAAGTATWDAGAADASWIKDVDNDAAARWGVFYNSTNAAKEGVCFVDLGAVFDMKTGDLTITYNVSGIWQLA